MKVVLESSGLNNELPLHWSEYCSKPDRQNDNASAFVELGSRLNGGYVTDS